MKETDSVSSDVDSYVHSENEDSGNDHESTTESDRISSMHDSSKGDTVAEAITKKDTRTAFQLRLLVILLFVGISIAVPIVIFKESHYAEESHFESVFENYASKVLESFKVNIGRKLG